MFFYCISCWYTFFGTSINMVNLFKILPCSVNCKPVYWFASSCFVMRSILVCATEWYKIQRNMLRHFTRIPIVSVTPMLQSADCQQFGPQHAQLLALTYSGNISSVCVNSFLLWKVASVRWHIRYGLINHVFLIYRNFPI